MNEHKIKHLTCPACTIGDAYKIKFINDIDGEPLYKCKDCGSIIKIDSVTHNAIIVEETSTVKSIKRGRFIANTGNRICEWLCDSNFAATKSVFLIMCIGITLIMAYAIISAGMESMNNILKLLN